MSQETVRRTQARAAERQRQRLASERKQRLVSITPLVLVGLLVIIGAGLVIYGSTQSASDVKGATGPRLQVDRDQVDFGDVKLGKTVRASFTITNIGDGTLQLDVPKIATVVEGC